MESGIQNLILAKLRDLDPCPLSRVEVMVKERSRASRPCTRTYGGTKKYQQQKRDAQSNVVCSDAIHPPDKIKFRDRFSYFHIFVTMKISAVAILALPLCGAFAPATVSRPAFGTSLNAVVTGPTGKAATSKEEDLALTLQIILDHDKRSTTVTKEQFIQQVEAAQAEPEVEETDISIPYDAAAKLAYEASDKSMDFADFNTQYLADAVALVKSKQPIDVSIPYDAAAKQAYEASDKSMAYDVFKTKYEADAVELVKSKQPVDISIPYDATAKLAYESSDKSMAYADFKTKYLADAVALVKSKQPVDISIPYDAAAKLAYESSDKAMPYADFKTKYEADAVELVKSKSS